MKKNTREFPMSIQISFKKLFDDYETHLDSTNEIYLERAKHVLSIAKEYPVLSEGIKTQEELKRLKPQIDEVTEDLFASVLTKNEIKIATAPFQEEIFRSSQRYKDLVEVAGTGYNLELTDFSDDQFYIMGCSMILGIYYGYKVDFRRPFYYSIPDRLGIQRYYRVLYNGDFVEIEKGPNAIEITPEDVSELIDNFDNIDMWKEKFPPDSWIFKGFVIANMYDATIDVSLTQFKEYLLNQAPRTQSFVEDFRVIIRAIFNLPNLEIGYSLFNEEEGTFEQMPELKNIQSYILNGKKAESCSLALCERSHDALFKKHEFYCISDVEKFKKLYPKNVIYQKLSAQGIQSAIIASIVHNEEVFGVLEIVSPNVGELNTINANKLLDIMPALVDAVRRGRDEKQNLMELLVQKECTAIHPSVNWKFMKEAQNVLRSQMDGNPVAFQEIVFEDVYPLFGQIDIKGSSTARNEATKNDLILQLKLAQKVIKKIYQIESLPIYEQINFTISNYLKDLKQNLQVDSERRILSFLQTEIVPLYDHLSDKSADLAELVSEYYHKIDSDKGFVYKHRKNYDESVMLVNKRMAAILDEKQVEAQEMYPHYFERFKTDGVEHNLYIGESITKDDSFNKIYLYNLRLWQLQVMCEMENDFYKLKEELPIPLDVASMILVFNNSLSLRFRMDEKRFDVDGTYNARYEVVKKRVDKANIKGTSERVTQPGKITIIYSQRSDELEFLKYVEFLQSKRMLGKQVEIHELEDLQGVTGLKAIRVNVLYNRGEDDKEYYTYEDLMKEIGTN